MNEIVEFLRSCGVYFIATSDNGQARVRPFGTIDLWEGRLTILTGAGKDVAAQINADPRIEISAVGTEGRWLRLTANAVRLKNRDAEAHMLDAYPHLKGSYRPGEENTALYVLENGIAHITQGAETKTYDI